MGNKHFREDYKHSDLPDKVGREAIAALEDAIEHNNAIGSLIGYYDDALTIVSVGDYLLHNLEYTAEAFLDFTKGSLRRAFYGAPAFLASAETFRQSHGALEGRMISSDKTPVAVQIYKEDAVDTQGTPIWVLAIRVGWEWENLELINAAIQSGPWYMDCDREGKIISVNWSQTFRKILGYNDTVDFPNVLESWSDLLHPEDKEATLKLLYAALQDKTNAVKYNVRYRLRMRDGSYQWFRAIAEITRRLDGTVRRIAGIFINIDKESRLLRRSQRSDALHRAFTKANLCEYYVNLDKNRFEALKAEPSPMTALEGSSSWDELVQAFLAHYVCEEYRPTVRQFYNRAYLAQKLHNLETELSMECRVVIDGQERWLRNVVMRGEEVDSQYAMVFLRDITEAKEEARRRSDMLQRNDAMEHLIHSMSRIVDHFVVCDLENDRYDYVNVQDEKEYPEHGRYCDFTALVAEKYKTLPPLAEIKQLVSAGSLREILRSKEDILKFEYCSHDEKSYCMASFIPLSFADGAVNRVLWTSTDITKAKMDEIAARKALTDACHAAERANRAKTEFLTNMSHDIRTPMNAIVGMTAIAAANMDNPERVMECLGKITASSRHLLGLINEVLDMARIESGRISLTEEEFHLSDLVDNLLAMVKPSMEEHHHSFEVHINRMEHEDVCGDSLRIQQVFVNLMSNAMKYTPDGGKIIFSIEEKPNKHSGLGCYEFTVEDNGIGMTPEFQKIMFEPFTRADDHRTTKVQGAGLGMAVTKNIVSMMNGDIRVVSAPEKGTKVTVTFFLKLQHKNMGETRELENLPVLVVDDDRSCCESTTAMLKDIGIAGEWVLSGQEAVARTLARHKENDDFFAILMDWKMPGMDGIETTRRIRQHIGSDVTIIVLTAYDYTEIEEEARSAGVNAFIPKPLFRSRLTAALKEIAQGKAKPHRVLENSLDRLSARDYTGKNILVVEDNELNREIAVEFLRMTGARVETADNGEAACEMVAAAPEGWYDLIFMDIQMPKMNGYEATAVIRAMEGRRGQIPIVAMTANAFAEDVLLAKNTGMNEHIAKPLDLDKMVRVLDTWLTGGQKC